MEASRAMLARADHLFAVWDGKPARGYGGTADVVAEARQRGVPVTAIWPEAPAAIKQRERCNLIRVTEPLPRDWWTTRDVASFLNVAPSTIRAYVARTRCPKPTGASAENRSGGPPPSANGIASDPHTAERRWYRIR